MKSHRERETYTDSDTKHSHPYKDKGIFSHYMTQIQCIQKYTKPHTHTRSRTEKFTVKLLSQIFQCYYIEIYMYIRFRFHIYIHSYIYFTFLEFLYVTLFSLVSSPNFQIFVFIVIVFFFIFLFAFKCLCSFLFLLIFIKLLLFFVCLKLKQSEIIFWHCFLSYFV